MDLENLAGIQVGICFDLDNLASIMPRESAAKIKRVIITGCGDSYSASGAMVPGFKRLSGLKTVNSPDIMDFCRFYTERKILKGYNRDEVLVLSISFSGGAERVAEALNKAGDIGVESMLITRMPDSKGGRAAKRIYNVNTPDGLNTPGLRSYFASMVGIASIAAYLGVCNGALAENEFYTIGKSIAGYVENFMEDIGRIDDQMFEEAIHMKDLTKFEVIADGNEGYSAQFVEQKIIECSGVFCDHTTSEEFAHISFMFRGPFDFGTIVMINHEDPSLSRMKDTIMGALKQHRPTIIVTDCDASEFEPKNEAASEHCFPGGMHLDFAGGKMDIDLPAVCTVAKAPEQWMSVFVDFIPGSLLAGYHAAVNEKFYFGGNYDFRNFKWIGRT